MAPRNGTPSVHRLRRLALRANQAAELSDLYHQGVFRGFGPWTCPTFARMRHHGAPPSCRPRMRSMSSESEPGSSGSPSITGGTAAVPASRLLDALGCDVVAVDARAGARLRRFSDPEEANLGELSALVRRAGADIGFTQDEDRAGSPSSTSAAHRSKQTRPSRSSSSVARSQGGTRCRHRRNERIVGRCGGWGWMSVHRSASARRTSGGMTEYSAESRRR